MYMCIVKYPVCTSSYENPLYKKDTIYPLNGYCGCHGHLYSRLAIAVGPSSKQSVHEAHTFVVVEKCARSAREWSTAESVR